MRFSLLGPLEVMRDGTAVDLGSPKQRAVLALLLLDRGHVVSTQRICASVWGERLPANTTASLHAYISNLRRLLRDDVTGTSPIVRQPPGYLLDVPTEQTDVGEFRALASAARTSADAEDWPVVLSTSEQALALWRGPLLADLADRDWVSVAATGLDEIVVECREHHLCALLASAQIAPALVEVVALRRAHPLRDRTCWLHMLTLYRAGRSPEALEVYRRHAAHLDEELGLEPGPELRDLQGAILRHDPELTAWPRRPGWTGARPTEAPAPATPSTPPATTDPPPASTLVGRRREIEAVEHLVADVVGGATRWLTLVGPAGIGKTRLAQFASNRVIELGGSSVWARNPEETTPIWWSMRQLVRGLGDDADTVLAVPAGVDPDTARFAVYERVQSLIENHARSGPLALVVDDVQWTDPASLGCLAFLSTALTDRSVAVVLTLRDQAADPALTRLLAGAARGQANRQIAIPAMTPAEVAVLADQIAEESLTDAERATLAERTGGNPLFVSEYARLSRAERAEGEIPVAVRSVLDRRLAALDPAVHDVLRAAAVVDDVLDIRLLSRVCGLDLDTVADLLDIAADRRIITTGADSDGYVFAHGLLREEVVATMPAFARRRLHATVAENLGATGRGGDTLSRRAHHLMAAGPLVDPTEVVAACAAAADDAAARWSSETAAVWWRHALDSYDRLPLDEQDPSARDRLTMALLQAEGRAGRGQTVLDTVRVQLLGAIDAGRVVTTGRLAGALLRSSGCWPWQAPSTDPGPLIEVLERAERFTAGDPEAHITVLSALAVGHCYNPDAAVPAGYLRRAADLAARADDPDLTADALLAWLITYSGVATHSHETLVAVDRLLALDHAQSRVDTVIGHSVATMATMSLGDVAATENHLRRGIEGSEELRLPVLRAQLRWMESTLALWRGDLPEAHRQHAIARDVHEQTELYVAGSGMIAVMGLGWEQGTLSDLALTDDPMRWMQTVIEERGDNGMVGVVVAGTAAIAGARGDRSLAETMLDRWWDQRGVHVWTTLGNAVLLAHLVADLGLVDHVERFIADLEPFADRIAVIGQVGSAGPVSLALGRLHRCVGRTDVARAHASDALALGERTGGIPTMLRARLLLADLTDPSPARTAEITDIADRARRSGMRGVADAAAAILAD